MANHALTIYASASEAEAALEAIADTVEADIVPFMEAGRQKFALITSADHSLAVAKAAVYSTALPTAGTDILSEDVSPTASPSTLQIYVCVTVAGVLTLARTNDSTTTLELLNCGESLVANSGFIFSVPWRSGDTVNLRYSATGGTISTLLLDEVQ
jgi:hypothetical protein